MRNRGIEGDSGSHTDSLTFSQDWFAAGIVTAESAADFARYARTDPSKQPRFWRWAAFQDFVEETGPLPANACRAAYDLGRREPDANLGRAMVAHVLYEQFCPEDVWTDAQIRFPQLARRVAAVRSRSTPMKEEPS
jgi:hypothetical protein